MNKPAIQVIHDADMKRVIVRELLPGDKPLGDNRRYFHPDVEIWVKGRDSHLVGYNIMLALQDRHMPVRALIRTKIR